MAGRVIAPSEDAANALLDDHGIIVDSLGQERAPSASGVRVPRPPLFPQALEDALEAAGMRIRFEQLARYHEGHGVWVLDQQRIGPRVMRLVDEATGADERRRAARDRVAAVLAKLAADRAEPGAERPAEASAETLELKAEISRLMAAVGRMERELASRARRDAGVVRRRVRPEPALDERTHDEVLLEILESNLELLRGIRQ